MQAIEVNLRKISISPEIIKLIPAALAKRLMVLPLSMQGDSLVVAFRNYETGSMSIQLDSIIDAVDRIESHVDAPVIPVFVAEKDVFDGFFKRLYPSGAALEGVGAELLFRTILNQALAQRASDIHVDADEEGATVRYRVDGKVRDVMKLSPLQTNELTAVIKLNADLDIAERRTPLDGAISINLGGETVSLRLATIPTLNGEHLTLRILADSGSENLADLSTLGFSDEHYELLTDALEAPNGIILVSGPTGSGKTTTLYAALRYLRDKGGKHIISLEDPVEMPLAGVTQVKIDEAQGRVTFNKALRSVLRHDPDVVLVGEIRDRETADIAVRAALTGHLVLSTVHTNDAVGVITRLLDLQVPNYLIASTVRLVMAQRLVRRPSPHSMTWRDATEEEMLYMGIKDAEEVAPSSVKVPVVHPSQLDGGTGYSGRAALYEVVPMTHDLRKLLMTGKTEEELAHQAFRIEGRKTLHQDGVDKAHQGVTTLEEVKAVTASF